MPVVSGHSRVVSVRVPFRNRTNEPIIQGNLKSASLKQSDLSATDAPSTSSVARSGKDKRQKNDHSKPKLLRVPSLILADDLAPEANAVL